MDSVFAGAGDLKAEEPRLTAKHPAPERSSLVSFKSSTNQIPGVIQPYERRYSRSSARVSRGSPRVPRAILGLADRGFEGVAHYLIVANRARPGSILRLRGMIARTRATLGSYHLKLTTPAHRSNK